jgi:hypothetical protein
LPAPSPHFAKRQACIVASPVQRFDGASNAYGHDGVIRRPCGKISILSMEVARNYATMALPQLKGNALRKR